MRDYDYLRDLADRFEASLEQDRAGQLANRAIARAAGYARRRPRLVLAISSGLAAFTIGVVGLGVAANSAIPGEFLYSIDRAYESVGSFVGFDGGSSEERVLEAIALIDRGYEADAIDALGEALVAIEKETGLSGINRTLTVITQPEFALPPEINRDETAPVEAPEQSDVIAAAPVASESPLKLAAEMLLRSLQSENATNVDDLTAAVDGVEAAALALEIPAEDPVEETTTTTTEVVADESTTTTTLAGDESTTTTTSTTVVDNSSTTTTTEPDGGPIILPPQP